MRAGARLIALAVCLLAARATASASLDHRSYLPVAVRGEQLDPPTAAPTATRTTSPTATATHTVTATASATQTVTPTPTGPPSTLHVCGAAPTATATATGTATGTPGELVVAIETPARCDSAASGFAVVADVQARYQIQEVRAGLGGREEALAFSNGRWRGVLVFDGLGFGEHVVTVAATDVFGNRGEATTIVVNDVAPRLNLGGPLGEVVARPSLRVIARCDDDNPDGCVSIRLVGPPTQTSSSESASQCRESSAVVLASGTATIDADVSLAAYEGRSPYLCIFAEDSRGRRVEWSGQVHVESSSRLVEVASAAGLVVDADATRLLWVDQQPGWPYSSGVGTLTIRARAAGTDVPIGQTGEVTPVSARLTARGAIYMETRRQNMASDLGYLLDWRDGGRFGVDTTHGTRSLRVAGDYAVWAGPDATKRRDLASGAIVVLTPSPSSASAWSLDVAANGDVVTADTLDGGEGAFTVRRYRGGAAEILARPTGQVGPGAVRTDGQSVVYSRASGSSFEVVLAGEPEEVLASAVPMPTSAGEPLAIAGGWIAFVRPGSAAETQVWRRSPSGAVSQVSFFGASSLVETLAPNGELTLLSGGRRYHARPDRAPIDVGAAVGRALPIGGEWHVTIGRSLFRVATE
jgi:hypothetical protein